MVITDFYLKMYSKCCQLLYLSGFIKMLLCTGYLQIRVLYQDMISREFSP